MKRLLLKLFFILLTPLISQEIDHIIKTYKNGQKWYEGYLKDGKVDGLFTFWYRNGQKSYEENYKNGLRNGKFTGWFENGNISSEKYFKNNKREGKWTTWYDNGQKSTECFYKMVNLMVMNIIGTEVENCTGIYFMLIMS